jgi:uncharacterized protein YndB with AHSA1/START domain
MELSQISVQATISDGLETVWNCYTQPIHIVKWNFASPDWCCPSAENDMQVGGTYCARMEAKDGSFGFDFKGIYTAIDPLKSFTYGFDDRHVTVSFEEIDGSTFVNIVFDPESENPIDLQRNGWQAILNNFKSYVESLRLAG